MNHLSFLLLALLLCAAVAQTCTSDSDCSSDCGVLKQCFSGTCRDVSIDVYCGVERTKCVGAICLPPFFLGAPLRCGIAEACPRCNNISDCTSDVVNCQNPVECRDNYCYELNSYEYCGTSATICPDNVCLPSGLCNPNPNEICDIVVSPPELTLASGMAYADSETVYTTESITLSVTTPEIVTITEVRFDYTLTNTIMPIDATQIPNYPVAVYGCVGSNPCYVAGDLGFDDILRAFCIQDQDAINCSDSSPATPCPYGYTCVIYNDNLRSGVCVTGIGQYSTNCDENKKREVFQLSEPVDGFYIRVGDPVNATMTISNITYKILPNTDRGCTKGWGYWKNTEKRSCSVQEIGGEALELVLRTAPQKGNAYYILAHQLAGALCNEAEGFAAYFSSATKLLISDSQDLINQYSVSKIQDPLGDSESKIQDPLGDSDTRSLLPGHVDRKLAIQLSSALAELNEGKSSLPSCSDAVYDIFVYDYIMSELKSLQNDPNAVPDDAIIVSYSHVMMCIAFLLSLI